MKCVWCEKPIATGVARTLEEPMAHGPARVMDGVIHEKCLATFRAIMREALTNMEV